MTGPAGDALAAIDLVAGAGLSLTLAGGAGPVVDALLARLATQRPLLRLAASADLSTLEGGLDPLASIAARQTVRRASLPERVGERVLVVAGAERLEPTLAARLAAWLDEGAFAGGVVLLDEGGEDQHVPILLADRIAMRVDVGMLAGRDVDAATTAMPAGEPRATIGDDEAALLVEVATRLGVASLRAPLAALRVARAAAGDLEFAARVALAPRATLLPAPSPESEPEPQTMDADRPETDEAGPGDADRLIDAARAALPTGLIEGGAAARAAGAAGSAAARTGAAARGRLGRVRRGVPGRVGRLDLIATLIAAAPQQHDRGRRAGAPPMVRRDDLRIRRRQPRRRHATVIAVDASGSAAMQRLGEVKGAVEQLLAQSYVRRDEVALIAFRRDGAATLLPPTRSLARARRELAALPGGGGTPLAAGIAAGLDQAARSRAAGRSTQLVVITDGGANIARDGTADRGAAMHDAQAAARQVAALGIAALVIDASPRGAPPVRALAETMRARYLALPRADDTALAAAIGGPR